MSKKLLSKANAQIMKSEETSNSNPPRLKKRVLFVLGTLWGENGITTHLMALGKGFKDLGWEVAIASGIDNTDTDANQEAKTAIDRFKKEEIQHFEINFTSLGIDLINILPMGKTVQRLSTIVDQFSPDVIHLHSLSIAPYVKLITVRYRIPMISTSHLEPQSLNPSIGIKKLINQWISPMWGDRLIAISSEIQTFFETSIQSGNRVRRVHHGIDESYFRPPTDEERHQAKIALGLEEADDVICLIGRLDPVKGHDVLIQALAILKEDGLRPIALFAGKGYGLETQRVQLQAQQVGVLSQIRCLGIVDSRQVLWASDILTLPSRREGFPLVILEAMLCSIVTIRTPAAGALDQIQDGITGWIVPFDNPKELANRLKKTLQDATLKKKISQAALQVSRSKFTNNRMILNTLEIYNEVIVKNE